MSVWIEQFMAWGDSHPSFALLCVWIIRAAVVVLTAWIIQRLARSRSSSVRHCVWIGAFGALVLLIPQLLTAIPIRIPVQVQSSTPNETRVPSASAGNSSERSLAVEAPVDRPWNATDANASGFDPAPRTAASPAQAVPTSDVVAAASTRQRPGVIVPKESSIVFIMIVVYGVGLLSGLARIVVSGLRLRRFASNASSFSQEHRALAQSCAARLGLRSPPQCRVSMDVSMPLTFGVIRPIVLVPIDFQSFTVDQQRHCLLHEMAHVARRDACWNWLAEITTAVYWFHPSVHWARWQLRRSREDAADDAVVRSGERASAYSRSLLEITQNIVASDSQPVAAVHSGTNLQNRIGRLLDPRLNVDPQSRWTVPVIGIVFSLITLTGIHFQVVTGQTPTTAGNPITQRSNTQQSDNVSADIAADVAATTDERSTDVGLYDQFKAVELATSDDDDDQERIDIEFQGRVTDPSGPIADAVVLIREFVAFRGPSGRYLPPPIVARTTTDQQGRYHIRGIPIVRLKSLGLARWEVLVADPNDRLGLGAYALSSFDRRQPTPWKASIDIQLPGSEEIAAQVVTPAGSGIGDVRVAVKEINVPESVDFDAGPFFRGSKQGFPKQSHVYRFPTDELQLLARTDSDGRFAFQMPKNASLVLGLRQSESFPRLLRLSAPKYQRGIMATHVADEYVSPATIELRRLLLVSVAVEDEAGEAVKQFSLSALTPRGKAQSQRFQVSDDGELRTTKEF
ncbi:M56 family metallopeptidase, partial [Stieleria sp.]|uniref:M56 family metallopeptidase n=1 Tax=Stieleria sp. TaxID=2795976 RepID=UPI0035651DF6